MAPPTCRSGPHESPASDRTSDERGRPWEGDLSDEQASEQTVNDSVRHAELRRLIQDAQRLAEEIGDQAERDRQSYEAGYRAGAALARAMFDHGVDVGRAQVLHEIEAAQAEECRRLSKRALDALNTPFSALQALRYPGRTPEQLARLRRPA
jgi:hypothetical protein